MENKKTRSSNFELLRILAMLMIIISHIVCHCIVNQLQGENFLFVQPYFSKKILVLAFMNTFGLVGNAVFILISGFFMANREIEKINLGKISFKLLSQILFATVALMFGSLFLLRFLLLFNKFPNLPLINLNFFNNNSWFIGYYFIVILLGKIFLNKFLSMLDEKNYLCFLLSVLTLISLSWARSLIDNFASGLDVLFTGIFLYSFGGFVKKFNPFGKVRISFFFILIILVYFFVAFSDYNITMANLEHYSGGKFSQVIPGFANHQIVPLTVGICLFEIFRRIKIPCSKIINYLGASTLMVYLVHDNSFFYRIWDSQKWIQVLFYHPFAFAFKILIWTLMTFVAGLAAYSVYNLVMKILSKSKFIFLKKDFTESKLP